MRQMHIVDPEVLAAVMVRAGYKPGMQPSEELQRLATTIVDHCAEIAHAHRDLPGIAAQQIRAEWGLQHGFFEK
jgi:hypothetical protein